MCKELTVNSNSELTADAYFRVQAGPSGVYRYRTETVGLIAAAPETRSF
jgi:hypothetical protein